MQLQIEAAALFSLLGIIPDVCFDRLVSRFSIAQYTILYSIRAMLQDSQRFEINTNK